MAIGGHVIKCGLQPVLKSLVDAGAVTAFAMNGSGSIHDYELSLIAETSEDVGAVLHCGTFGMAEETGRDINRALREGVAAGCGYGESVGRFILAERQSLHGISLLALCAARNIPAPFMSPSAMISSISIRMRMVLSSVRPHSAISGC